MREAIADIVEGFLDWVDYSMQVETTAEVDGKTVISVPRRLHLRAGLFVTIDGTEYEVLSLVGEDSFIIDALLMYTPTTVTLPRPKYFHGTPMALNIELGTFKDADKFPAIYLYEVLRDRKIKTPDSHIDRIATLSLFYMDNCAGGWNTNTHYTKVLNRMADLAEFIEEKIGDYARFHVEQIDYIDYYNHADFGRFVTDKGHVSSFMDEQTSAVEQKFDLPIKYCLNCT